MTKRAYSTDILPSDSQIVTIEFTNESFKVNLWVRSSLRPNSFSNDWVWLRETKSGDIVLLHAMERITTVSAI